MLEKFLVLLERFVVAHELIAANSRVTALPAQLASPYAPEQAAEDEPAAEAEKPKRTRTSKAKKEPEPEPEPEEPKRARRSKGKAKDDAPDYEALREKIADIDEAIGSGDVEEANDAFDDLMDDFGAKTLKQIKDADLEEFLEKAQAIVDEYYEADE